MKRTYQPKNRQRKKYMGLERECQRLKEEKY